LERRIVATFNDRPGAIVSRDELLDRVYADRREPEDLKAIDQRLHYLRRKGFAIRNKRGRGWIMEPAA
jgi:DNA-binding response OmpR family regulator